MEGWEDETMEDRGQREIAGWKIEEWEEGGRLKDGEMREMEEKGMREMERLEIQGWEKDGGIERDGRKVFLEDRRYNGSAGPGRLAQMEAKWGLDPLWQPGGEGIGLGLDGGPGPPSIRPLLCPPGTSGAKELVSHMHYEERGVPTRRSGQTHLLTTHILAAQGLLTASYLMGFKSLEDQETISNLIQ